MSSRVPSPSEAGRRGLLALLGAAFFCGWAAETARASGPEIDVDECRACHEAAVKSLQATRHFGVESRCAACHAGVDQHLRSMTQKGEPGGIELIRKAPVQKTNSACEACHSQGRPAHFQGGPHDRRGVGCTGCHSVHGFRSEKALLKAPQESESCFQCHPSVRVKMKKVSHHPVREGAMQCSACHDIHGSNPKLVAADWVNETCYQCHTEKRGPFLWEHAPARDNCLNCHEPHGSNHRGLLVSKPPYLCQRCHLNTLHAALMYDARDTPRGSAPSAFGTGRACANCHRSMHGTNAPSATILIR